MTNDKKTNQAFNAGRINCPHLDDDICQLASWMTTPPTPIKTTPEICAGCLRCEHPGDINPVTLALADIQQTEEGPGTKLSKLLSWFVRKPENCQCPDRVLLMNSWGKERCREEIRVILGWLRESALDNNYPYSEYAISAILKIILK